MAETIGTRIRDARRARGLSQAAFAKATGIRVYVIATVEIGKTRCTAMLLRDISDALDVSADYLLRGREWDGPVQHPMPLVARLTAEQRASIERAQGQAKKEQAG